MRVTLEVIGTLLYLAAQVLLVFVYVLGISVIPTSPAVSTQSSYWTTLVLGYVFCIGVLRMARRRGEEFIAVRARFDRFLIALPFAVIATWILVTLNFPLHLEGLNAHGFGIPGGTANVIFFPWFHGLSTLLMIKGKKPLA